MAKTMARWWKGEERKRLTLSYFFSFPDIINDAEARTHALFCWTLLILILIMNFFEKSVVLMGLYVCYGFVARACCGSRIDPQAHVILFLVIPFRDWLNSKLNSKAHRRQVWFPNSFRAGTPKRVAQVTGAIISIIGVTLLLLSQNATAPPGVAITGYVFLGMIIFASTLQWAADICLACVVVYYCVDHRICSDAYCQAINMEKVGVAFADAANNQC